jgi:hypothetical protein
VLAEPRALRDAYLQALERFLAAVATACARERADYRRVHTGEPLDGAILSVAGARARQARRSR